MLQHLSPHTTFSGLKLKWTFKPLSWASVPENLTFVDSFVGSFLCVVDAGHSSVQCCACLTLPVLDLPLLLRPGQPLSPFPRLPDPVSAWVDIKSSFWILNSQPDTYIISPSQTPHRLMLSASWEAPNQQLGILLCRTQVTLALAASFYLDTI